MRIGELADRAGTTTRALRYYESLGLLPPAARTGNGYRSYGEEHLRMLEQIRSLQDFGFGLEETRPFVECLRAGHASGDACEGSLEVYRRKLAELDACVARLQEVRASVAAQLARAELASGPREPMCELGRDTAAPAGSPAGSPADSPAGRSAEALAGPSGGTAAGEPSVPTRGHP
jgi:DNA-binding transcriptional MerR regulator